ncbi:transcriptional regulator [Pectobacterium brasiliense]|uniref:Helix-turn-helix domain-containing protein n=1 Tax=Pectobacterium brasiliense TaxID=180957 RepID=A0A3S0Y2C2_9GAMM|nr:MULTISPECIES: YdaS family helix-turn-helix protein [Pectobacterium]GKW27810.1 hypothetical protein PEC331060_09880 [Pectobacterium carotovorum subsp. carotovorum]MBN3046552.1 helix-turn-helix domain-containing protein [Pectobacterium brasiliense]MBN3056805.1 helix-turn-helix domain-containing protein [Pectobacterium brasiliense]MBN3075315.1 helix-turn-helix domain-containing protein [Pectobacterium brasiliense]MBN3083559.1 helix-turn-helix domain-containing protein [Pectobacterium brasilien
MKEQVQKKILAVCGSQSELARRVGKNSQTVSAWFRNEVASAEVINASRALEWKVTPHELRPDLYPNPTDGLPKKKEA